MNIPTDGNLADSAVVSELAAAPGAADADTLWSRFTTATSAQAYVNAWLGLLCQDIEHVSGAVVLLGNPDAGPYTPAGVWPDGNRDFAYLAEVADKALRERQAMVIPVPGDHGQTTAIHIAYPVLVSGALYGVAALDLAQREPESVQHILRRLHWGIAWLEVLVRRQNDSSEEDPHDEVLMVLEFVAATLDQERFHGACTALATELAQRLECSRVSVGFVHGGQVRLQAISHSATFGHELNLVRLLGEAMDEAIDQESSVRFPADRSGRIATRAHDELAGQHTGGAEILTLPVPVNGEYQMALTLERPSGHAFTDEDAEICETTGAVVAPVLILKRDDERWLIVKAGHALRRQFTRLVGPGHLVRKSFLLGAILVGVFFAFARGDYELTADAALEGSIQRSVVAPFEGFIQSAEVRAGDLVEEGQLLSVLEDQDLKLERLRLSTQRNQLLREQREAAANKERAQVTVLGAQMEQTAAQIALLDEQLARTRLRAPFRGMVVSGDLSQSLGAPVKQGEVLFEIAPLDTYRLILQVDERDITDAMPAQTGELVLNSMPEVGLPFRVVRITPVSTPSEGRNYFRLEAVLDETPESLRPGMQGIGKVLVGERHLAWIWTRRLVDWLRLKLWVWWP